MSGIGNPPLDTPLVGTPTFSQIFNSVRRTHLADASSDTGSLATDTRLLSAGQDAYRVMYQALAKVESPKLRRTAYWLIPSYTSYLSPLVLAKLGLPPVGAPISIYERAHGCSLPILSLTPNLNSSEDPNPYVDLDLDLPSASPAIVNGSSICVYGCNAFTSDINDEWSITLPPLSTSRIRLQGCTATALPLNSTNGWVMNSPEPWPLSDMNRQADMRDLDLQSSSASISIWTWTDDAFRFRPANQPRQIKIKYKISPEPPIDLLTPLGVPGSLPFLASYTAALFANSVASGKSMSSSLFTLATGHPAGEIGDAVGGYLGLLAGLAIKTNQMPRIVVGRFRRKRSTSTIICS